MIVEQVIGNISDLAAADLAAAHLERVYLPLEALRKKVQRVGSDHGREFGIRLAPHSPNLKYGDILIDEPAAAEPGPVETVGSHDLDRGHDGLDHDHAQDGGHHHQHGTRRNLVVVAVESSDVLLIAPESVYQMGVVAHTLGNRHLPAQFFPAGEDIPELGKHQGVMVIQYDHTAEDYLRTAGIRYARAVKTMPVPFHHAEHTH